MAQDEGAEADDHHQHQNHPEEHRSWNTEVPCIRTLTSWQGAGALRQPHSTALTPDCFFLLDTDSTVATGPGPSPSQKRNPDPICSYLVQPSPPCPFLPGSEKPMGELKS